MKIDGEDIDDVSWDDVRDIAIAMAKNLKKIKEVVNGHNDVLALRQVSSIVDAALCGVTGIDDTEEDPIVTIIKNGGDTVEFSATIYQAAEWGYVVMIDDEIKCADDDLKDVLGWIKGQFAQVLEDAVGSS